MHAPIVVKDLTLCFSKKICFESFSTHIYPGQRIAIIGPNGSGKSSLIKMLCHKLEPSSGGVSIPDGLSIGYVEQTIDRFHDLSGGQRFNKRLSEVLSQWPDVLLLDEPTNHLDQANRKGLMRMLARYQGILVVVSHDTELLRSCVDTIWYIDHQQVSIFKGTYDDYLQTRADQRNQLEKEISGLKHQKKELHNALMKEQKRAASSRRKGEKSIDRKKWPTIVSHAKARRAEQSTGKKRAEIKSNKHQLHEQLSGISVPERIVPTFSLTSDQVSGQGILSIHDGSVGYSKEELVLRHISLNLLGSERISIKGGNGSGKTTLLKAILGQNQLYKIGQWQLPALEYVGYLDQHYSNLNGKQSVLEHLTHACPHLSEAEVQKLLGHFLFRKPEDLNQLAESLSGGEKARLALCLVAAKTPRLLILDEITNNLDLETKEHVVQVLRAFPAAMIVVSHEPEFLQEIGIEQSYRIEDGRLV